MNFIQQLRDITQSTIDFSEALQKQIRLMPYSEFRRRRSKLGNSYAKLSNTIKQLKAKLQ